MASTPPAHTKATREDWVDAALASLDDVPIDRLKVLTMAGDLDVSRSSFYWYFENLEELQAELLALWGRNTDSLVERSARPADGIVAACLGVFECWTDPRLYDARLDLAVRDWGRRDRVIAARVASADAARLDAMAAMFARHGFAADDSVVRARLLYHSQVGYYAVGIDEPMAVRLGYMPYYVEAMTGVAPTADQAAAFAALVASVTKDPGTGMRLAGPARAPRS